MASEHVVLQQLVGSALSAVTFVQDYVQLWFDGRGINIYSPMRASAGSVSAQSGDDHFHKLLCDQITKIVARITIIPQRNLCITFADASAIVILLGDEDDAGPEALYYHGFEGDVWGVI